MFFLCSRHVRRSEQIGLTHLKAPEVFINATIHTLLKGVSLGQSSLSIAVFDLARAQRTGTEVCFIE